MHRKLLAFAAIVALSGCVSAPPQSSYGPKPSYDHDAVEAQIRDALIDPESARFDFGEPRKAYRTGVLGGTDWTGYLAIVGVNAKNRMGGYSGEKPYYVMFDDGQPTLHSYQYEYRLRLKYADGSDVPAWTGGY